MCSTCTSYKQPTNKVQECFLLCRNRQEAIPMAELEDCTLSIPVDLACRLLDTLNHLGVCRKAEPCRRPDACQGMHARLEWGVPRIWKWKMIFIINDHNICSSGRPITRAGIQVKKGGLGLMIVQLCSGHAWWVWLLICKGDKRHHTGVCSWHEMPELVIIKSRKCICYPIVDPENVLQTEVKITLHAKHGQ